MEKYLNIHQNKDIYIICSGKSCDFVPNIFFENKITISVNQSFRKIKTNYVVRRDYTDTIDSNISEHPTATHFIAKSASGGSIPPIKKQQLVQRLKNIDIILFDHNPIHLLTVQFIQKLSRHQILVAFSSVISAVYIAFYMGAKNIILVGHDGGTLDNELYFHNYVKDRRETSISIRKAPNPKEKYKSNLAIMHREMMVLRKFLQLHNCTLLSINPFIGLHLENHTFSSRNVPIVRQPQVPKRKVYHLKVKHR